MGVVGWCHGESGKSAKKMGNTYNGGQKIEGKEEGRGLSAFPLKLRLSVAPER